MDCTEKSVLNQSGCTAGSTLLLELFVTLTSMLTIRLGRAKVERISMIGYQDPDPGEDAVKSRS
eukprot:203176-Hanusia_phi.AAC.1